MNTIWSYVKSHWLTSWFSIWVYIYIYKGISIHLLLSIPASAREWKAAALSAIELSVSQ